MISKLSSLAVIAALWSTAEAECPPTQPDCSSAGNSTSSTWPMQTYRSSSVTAPNLTITGNGKPLSPGYTFFDSYIMTQKNDLVYADKNATANNFRVQKFKGKDYLTYWLANATNTAGYGYGSLTMLDSEYVPTTLCIDLGLSSYPVSPRPVCQFDAHEQLITERNTLLVTGYNYTRADLSSVGGPVDGYLFDSHFFEIDIDTHAILFSWAASDHVPFTATHLTPSSMSNGTATAPFDYFHINSLQLVGDNYLVNSRHTWSTFLVSGQDGSIIWTFNSTGGGDFGPAGTDYGFSWQHYARAHNVSNSSITLSYFANNNDNVGTTPTTGLVFELGLPPSKDQAVTQLRHLEVTTDELYVGSQGSYQVEVGGGNQFMGYGQVPVMREYGPATDGSDLRWEARFNNDGGFASYRAYKQEWCGTPKDWDPSLAVIVGGGAAAANGTANGTTGYVSWNGATDVQKWNVYTGQNEGGLQMVGSVPVKGFETDFSAPSMGCVQVEAVMDGATRKSNVVCN